MSGSRHTGLPLRSLQGWYLKAGSEEPKDSKLVGERGFEPPTPWSRTRCSTRLSHSPTLVETESDHGTRTGRRKAGPAASNA
jgi:hypothetical protein